MKTTAEGYEASFHSERPDEVVFDPSTALSLELLRQILPASVCAAVRREEPVIVLIEAPGARWVASISRGLDKMFDPSPNLLEYAKPPRLGDISDIRVIRGPTFVVASDPAWAPAHLIAGADYRIAAKLTPNVVRRAFRTLYGRGALVRPADIAGLDWQELMVAMRPGSTPAACLSRLRATSAKLRSTTTLDATPTLDALPGFGDAMSALRAIAADVVEVREGSLAGAALPSVLLYGRPGTGKTTLARSLAKTVDLPFVASSIGEWFAGSSAHLGTVIGAARAFFDQAAACAPCVAFLDELDALPNRMLLDEKGRDWWTPVVTTVLVAIDKMRAKGSGVVLVGATNHLAHLDAALTRAGRFDIHLEIFGPTCAADVESILRHHLGSDLAGFDLAPVARVGMATAATGATLEQWVKAARALARSEKRSLTIGDLTLAALPASSLPPEAELRIALHEAAHAVVARQFGIAVSSVSMIEDDQSFGRATFDYAHAAITRVELEHHVVAGLAGRAADELLCSGADASASSDLVRATQMVVAIHGALGLGDRLLSRNVGDRGRDLLAGDPTLGSLVEAELQRLMSEARRLVASHEPAIRALARTLLIHRVAGQVDIDASIALITGSAASRPEEPVMDEGLRP